MLIFGRQTAPFCEWLTTAESEDESEDEVHPDILFADRSDKDGHNDESKDEDVMFADRDKDDHGDDESDVPWHMI